MSEDRLSCSKCGTKLRSNFHPSAIKAFDGRTAKGLTTRRPYCRPCSREYQKEYQKRPEVIRRAKQKKAAAKRKKAAAKKTQTAKEVAAQQITPVGVLSTPESDTFVNRLIVDLLRAQNQNLQSQMRELKDEIFQMNSAMKQVQEKTSQTHAVTTKHAERIRRIDRAIRGETTLDNDDEVIN